MKKIIFLTAFIFISIVSFSQTKRIAHRSHSGKDNSFIITAGLDNFGLPVPDRSKTKNKNKNKQKNKPALPIDSVPGTPPKDTLRTMATALYNQHQVSWQEELVVALMAAKKMFNL